MQLWSSDKAAEKLFGAKMGEWEKTKYFILQFYFQLLILAVPSYFWGGKIDGYGLLSYLLAGAVFYFSIVSLYKINIKQANVSCIEVLVVLGLPSSIKATVYYCAAFVVLVVFSYFFGNINLIIATFNLCGYPIYCWFLYRQIINSTRKFV